MKLHIRVKLLREIKHPAVDGLLRYKTDENFVDVKADLFTDAQLDKLYARAKSDGGEGSRALMQKITAYRNIRANPSGQRITKLEPLVTAMKGYIEPSPNKWLFYTEDDGFALPYYVADISYDPGERRGRTQPSVELTLKAITRGSNDGKTIRFRAQDLGKTVVEILNAEGLYLETPEAVKSYWDHVETYKTWAMLTGSQFHAIGTGFPVHRYGYGEVAMEREGQPSTVVMDDATDEDEGRREQQRDNFASTKFWTQAGKKGSGDDEEDEDYGSNDGEDELVAVPVHPYVKTFDLAQHQFVLMHVGNLTPYVYDKSAAAKLVLPKQTKDLVTILVQGSTEVMEDIIKGKTGGTIVITTGPPGTGKTLTAEVFSEQIERPLYVVQCSQLGTNEETVEKQLVKVLTRASRWQAILLIDEADVYVHERGTDIQQNAIVGVFLRVLERYRGVLFLTSNRATIIDDAIMSRATAWIRYEYPTMEQLGELWAVLSKQYKMPLPPATITKLVEVFPGITGRNIKNLLKLTRLLAKANNKATPTAEMFQNAAAFLDLHKSSDNESVSR